MDLNDLTPEQRAEVEEKLKNMSPEELAKLQSQECIFCQIVSGKIPSKKVHEDDLCVALLDINPATKGHILLMPKEHISIMPQLDDKIGSHLLQVSRELSRSLLKNLHASGSTIFVANGLAAGQRAQHFMIHIIPRKEGDGLFSYEKHIIDEEKRRALRDLVAARMAQLTDFEDVYATESSDSEEEAPEKPKENETEETQEEINETEEYVDSDEEIELDQVPQNVLEAAQKALPGIELDEAELETKTGTEIYDLEGVLDGKRYELKISSSGEVLSIEDDDNDDEDKGEDSEETEESDESEDDKELEDNEEEETRPGELTDSSLDDIANLFK